MTGPSIRRVAELPTYSVQLVSKSNIGIVTTIVGIRATGFESAHQAAIDLLLGGKDAWEVTQCTRLR